MSSTRPRVAIAAALLTATFFAFSVASAQGLSDRMRATIPFDFYVGENLLPAGEYQMQTLTSGVVRLYNPETDDSVMFNTVRLSNPTQDPSKGQLIFHRYGDDCFLAQMWWGGRRDGFQPIQSKRERELARLSTPVRITVVR